MTCTHFTLAQLALAKPHTWLHVSIFLNYWLSTRSSYHHLKRVPNGTHLVCFFVTKLIKPAFNGATSLCHPHVPWKSKFNTIVPIDSKANPCTHTALYIKQSIMDQNTLEQEYFMPKVGPTNASQFLHKYEPSMLHFFPFLLLPSSSIC